MTDPVERNEASLERAVSHRRLNQTNLRLAMAHDLDVIS